MKKKLIAVIAGVFLMEEKEVKNEVPTPETAKGKEPDGITDRVFQSVIQ